MLQVTSSEWCHLFDENSSYQPSTYKSLDDLDDVASLSFLKDLIWEEIRAWVRDDTTEMSPTTHKDLEGPGRIYLGGMNHALNDQLLAGHNISAVITIHPRDLLAWSEQDPSYGLRRFGSEGCPVQHHLMIPLEDKSNSNLIQHFDETNNFIHKHMAEGHNMLIHCKSGRSRSVAVLIAYLQHKYYETTVGPQGLAPDQAVEMMQTYSEAVTDVVRQQRLPVIIIMERFQPLLRLYELQLTGHPDYEMERRTLFPDPGEQHISPPLQSMQPEVNVKGGAAVLKICTAIVFFQNKQKPMKSVVQRLFELNEAYFYELEGSEFNGRSYVQSRHAHRGIITFYADFAQEYSIPLPVAVLKLTRSKKMMR